MLNVYLAGEIHSNWREEIIQICEKEKLDVKFTSPITDHEASDNCGVEILGAEEKNFWKDRKGANINSIAVCFAIHPLTPVNNTLSVILFFPFMLFLI